MVLDSSPIVAIFKREDGFQSLERKIDEAEEILIGAPTALETMIVMTHQTGVDYRGLVDAYLRSIEAKIVVFSDDHYSVAARAYFRYGRGFHPNANLSFGDCMSYAVAHVADQPLLFTGNDFSHTDIIPA